MRKAWRLPQYVNKREKEIEKQELSASSRFLKEGNLIDFKTAGPQRRSQYEEVK
jgi:hypothetical protein